MSVCEAGGGYIEGWERPAVPKQWGRDGPALSGSPL